MELTIALVTMLVIGCTPTPGKPDVQLPPVQSNDYQAQSVLTFFAGRNVRELEVVGTTLYVGHDLGLALFDIASPANPLLLSELSLHRADSIATDGQTLYAIDISGTNALSTIDVSAPTTPELIASDDATTLTFGGLALNDDLLWRAVGSNPPSQVYQRQAPLTSCNAPDKERGVMDVWLTPHWGFASVHFDDYAGDGLDGNGSYGMVAYRLTTTNDCPTLESTDIFFFDTHAKNRSTYERSSNSDLQFASLANLDRIYLSGEQTLRSLSFDQDSGTFGLLAELPIPELLDVDVAVTSEGDELLGLANGNFQLVDAANHASLLYVQEVSTSDVSRLVRDARDGRHFYIAGDDGITIIEYEKSQ